MVKTRKNKKGGVKGTGTGTGKYSTQKRVGNFTAKNYTNIGKKRGLTLDQRKATNLMNMLHKNVTHTLSGGLHKDKPYDTMTINKSFRGLIGKPGTADATKKENVYTDMSGLIDSNSGRNEVRLCIEQIKIFLYACGPKKLLFGTDFPVQTHSDSVFFIEEAMKGFSEADKQDVYYNNAAKLLKCEN